MKTSTSTIGIVAAIALGRAGHDVVVFEQARQFARVGADGIHSCARTAMRDAMPAWAVPLATPAVGSALAA